MFLLDTNCCIDFALARNDPLRARIRKSYPRGLAISSITLAELRVGTRNADADPEDERRLDRLIALITVHPFHSAAAEHYGDIVREAGLMRRSFDRLIGAHARALNLILVTNNERDFADIPGLRVENWTR